jgi:DNA-binding CsgD family transcriptional regulator
LSLSTNSIEHFVQERLLKTLQQTSIYDDLRLLQLLDAFPSILCLHDYNSFECLYINKAARTYCGLSLQQLQAMGASINQKLFEAAAIKSLQGSISAYFGQDAPTEYFNYTIKARNTQNGRWNYWLCRARLLEEANLVISHATNLDAYKLKGAKIERLLKEQRFIQTHAHLFALLSEREVQILKLIATGLTSAEIAKKADITQATAQQHRKNIKKKLQIKRFSDYIRYIISFDLMDF